MKEFLIELSVLLEKYDIVMEVEDDENGRNKYYPSISGIRCYMSSKYSENGDKIREHTNILLPYEIDKETLERVIENYD